MNSLISDQITVTTEEMTVTAANFGVMYVLFIIIDGGCAVIGKHDHISHLSEQRIPESDWCKLGYNGGGLSNDCIDLYRQVRSHVVQGDLRCASQSMCAGVSKSVLERVQHANMLVERRLLLRQHWLLVNRHQKTRSGEKLG